MARHNRLDDPGSVHHVYNRGLARRTMFETRRDKRLFLSLIARSVRRGEIKVISFCIMTTHFHMLVQSMVGRLDFAMQRVQTDYSRYFNRSRRRDGPLVRGRYTSKRVDSARYLEAVERYIDANPVQARLAARPDEYEFGSAIRLARGAGSRWLAPLDGVRGRDRPLEFDREELDSLADVVEARLFASSTADDALDELVEATPGGVLRWMRQKAQLADGTEPGLPVCHSRDVLGVLGERASEIRGLPRPTKSAPDVFAKTMTAGLLRHLCGLRHRQIAQVMGKSMSAASVLVQKHGRHLLSDQRYAAAAASVARAAVRRSPLRRQSFSTGRVATGVAEREEID